MRNNHKWPDLNLGETEADLDYIPPENIKLLLDGTEAALQSQVEGVRQMLSRLGPVASQASALASGSAGVVGWFLTHPVADRPNWIIEILMLAALFWSVSAGFAVAGMVGAKYGATGINPKHGYRQDVLGQPARVMQLWVIQSYAASLCDGGKASRRLRRCLNTAIAILFITPLVCIVIAAIGISS